MGVMKMSSMYAFMVTSFLIGTAAGVTLTGIIRSRFDDTQAGALWVALSGDGENETDALPRIKFNARHARLIPLPWGVQLINVRSLISARARDYAMLTHASFWDSPFGGSCVSDWGIITAHDSDEGLVPSAVIVSPGERFAFNSYTVSVAFTSRMETE